MERVAIVTGGSQGLGLALTRHLAAAGYTVAVDARRGDRLRSARAAIGPTPGRIVAVVGDVTSEDHRAALVAAAARHGPIGVVVNNASTLGASPLPSLGDVSAPALRLVFETNVIAPLLLVQEAGAHLAPAATVVDITSDAAVEAYPGWGAYGASKAALEHAGRVLAAERPDLRVLTVDPGDMRTEMHQLAFPGEDISDRPDPDGSAAAIVGLILGGAPSGRYTTADLLAEATGAAR